MSMRAEMLVIGLVPAVVCVASAPEDTTAYRAGIGLLNKGLNDAAERELRAYLASWPEGTEAANARYSLGVCLARLNRPAEAVRELDAVRGVKDFAFAADACLLSAKCSQAAGDHAAAIASAERLEAEFKAFAKLDQGAVVRGESLYALGKFRDAASVLEAATTRWPEGESAMRGRLFAALAWSAVGETKKAAEVAAEMVRKDPAGEYAMNATLLEADARRRLGETETAGELFAKAAATTAPVVKGEALLGVAQVERGRGALDKAWASLEQAGRVKVGGDFGERVELERARVLLDRKDAKGAVAILSRLEGTKGRIAAEASLWLGRGLVAMGEHARAVETFANGAERHKGSELAATLLFDRAGAIGMGGDDAGAVAAWEAWLKAYKGHALEPDATAAAAWAWHKLGKWEESEARRKAFNAEKGHAGWESMTLLAAENAYARGAYGEADAAYAELVKAYPKSAYAWRATVRRGLAMRAAGKSGEWAGILETAMKDAGGQDEELKRAAGLALGEEAIAKSEWAKAEGWLTEAAKEEKGAMDATLRLGIAVSRQGRSEEALKQFDRVIASGGKGAGHARLERGRALAAMGKDEEAKAAFSRVIADEKGTKEKPLTGYALRQLAALASKAGKSDEAAGLLARAAEFGGGGDAMLQAGLAYLSAGKYAEAEAALGRFLEEKDASAGDLVRAGVNRAIAVSRQGRADEALRMLDSLGEVKEADAETRAAAAYERAVSLTALKRPEDAAKALRAVLELPTGRLTPYAAADLADQLRRGEKYEEAVTVARRALEAAKALAAAESGGVRARAMYVLAAGQLGMKDAKGAAETLAGFEKEFGGSAGVGAGDLGASAKLLRGEALLASGAAKDAAAAFEGAAKAGSESVRMAATLRIGDAWAAAQAWAKAEEAYTAFLGAYGNSEQWFRARFGQGWARESQGRHDAAIEAYRDLVARHKGATAARAQFQIGECLYAQKKYELAVAEYAKTDVLFAAPEWSAAALYEAGRCLEELKKGREAEKQYDEVITRFPETQWAKLSRERKDALRVATATPGR